MAEKPENQKVDDTDERFNDTLKRMLQTPPKRQAEKQGVKKSKEYPQRDD